MVSEHINLIWHAADISDKINTDIFKGVGILLPNYILQYASYAVNTAYDDNTFFVYYVIIARLPAFRYYIMEARKEELYHEYYKTGKCETRI